MVLPKRGGWWTIGPGAEERASGRAAAAAAVGAFVGTATSSGSGTGSPRPGGCSFWRLKTA